MSKTKKQLRKTYLTALIALVLALVAMTAATFAWYIYNTSAHTTKVHMAAGTSISLEISNAYDGPFSTSTVLESFTGKLIPVSTDRIVNAEDKAQFQACTEFEQGGAGQAPWVTKLFGEAPATAFYKTSLYLRTTGSGNCDLYVSRLDYTDSDERKPISTATRVGFVVHTAGRNGAVSDQFIFAINPTGSNPEAEYNTATGQEGYVLDHTRIDGTTIPFNPYTPDNYADYDQATGEVSLRTTSTKLCTLQGDGEPVRVDVYIWLEGCDKDCTKNLSGMTLRDVSVSFAAAEEGSTN